MARVGLAIALTGWMAPAVHSNEWPQWRGLHSTGASAVLPVPERWSATEAVAWRAEIEGYGISSPVVEGKRVYVTTALASQRRSAARVTCDYAAAFLALLCMPYLIRTAWTRRMSVDEQHESGVSRVLSVADRIVLSAVALTILLFSICLALGPQATDAALTAARNGGVRLAQWLGRHHTHLWFVDWDESTRHNIWIISSGMALGSAALIPFGFVARPRARVFGALALFVGVALAIWSIPWSAAYGNRYPSGPLIVAYSPVLALAVWHLIVSRSRRITPVLPPHLVRRTSRWATAGPAFVAVGIFVSPNVFHQQELVTRRLISLDASTGRRIWHTDVFTTLPEAKFAGNSHATPTPSAMDNVIVAAFGPGIAAFNRDGALLWKKTFHTWIDNSIYGAGSSPVSNGRLVFVTSDREYMAQRQSWVSAYVRQTGTELWSNRPAFAHDGYATAVTYREGGHEVLVALTSRAIVGYLVADGSVTWRLRMPVSTPIPSPTIDGTRLFVTGGKGDGGFTGAYRLRPREAPLVLWESRNSPADVASPVVHKGRLFTISSSGIMVCYDADSGKMLWRQRLKPGIGVFYASLVAADDKIYATRSDGTTYVVSSEDRFRLIATSSLPEEIFASPAVTADCLLIRTVSALYCIRSPEFQAETAPVR